ncbi:MAG: hypothetical protein IJF78_12285 [Clostridia bacterium]|nr:hypothetical protein [Clostridia bacterium]
MNKAKDAVITVKSVFNGTKTDRQAFIDLILQRQQQTTLQNENILLNRKEIVDENPKIGYNDGTPNMRYTQATGGNV